MKNEDKIRGLMGAFEEDNSRINCHSQYEYFAGEQLQENNNSQQRLLCSKNVLGYVL